MESERITNSAGEVRRLFKKGNLILVHCMAKLETYLHRCKSQGILISSSCDNSTGEMGIGEVWEAADVNGLNHQPS